MSDYSEEIRLLNEGRAEIKAAFESAIEKAQLARKRLEGIPEAAETVAAIDGLLVRYYAYIGYASTEVH